MVWLVKYEMIATGWHYFVTVEAENKEAARKQADHLNDISPVKLPEHKYIDAIKVE